MLQPCLPAFDPPGLLLTWQRDPTTTMTLQWFEAAELLPLPDGRKGEVAPFRLPRLKIGRPPEEQALWRDGFAIRFLPTPDLRCYEASDFSAESRLAWTEAGIVGGIRVRQKNFSEATQPTKLWDGSSVEIILTDRPDAGAPPFHLSIAPGLDPAFPAPRTYLHPVASRPSPPSDQIRLKVTAEAGGYRLLVLIPWAAALPDFLAGPGKELGVQIYLNQGTRPAARRLAWYPSDLSGMSADFTHRIALSADGASPPYRATLSLERRSRDGLLSVYAGPGEAGKCVEIKEGKTVLGKAPLQLDEDNRVAKAQFCVPLPEPGWRWGVLEATLDDEESYSVRPALHPADFLPPASRTLGCGTADTPEALASHQHQTTVLPLFCWPGMFLHRVELTRLEPDTLYHFRPLAHHGAWNFRTLPKQLTRPIRIAIGGDMFHRPSWMEETARAAMEHDPDFIVLGGDLAETNGHPGAISRWEQWFSTLDRTVRTKKRRIVPILPALGNHDVQKGYHHQHPGYEPTDAWRKRLAPEFYEFFPFPGLPGYGVLDIGDDLSVLILDSGHTNPIAGAQTAWLEQALKERCQRRHVVPIYHIPAFPSVKSYHGKNETEVRRHWPPLFERYGVRIAFEHHNHAYKRTAPLIAEKIGKGGVVYFGDGAWGVTARPVHDPAQAPYLAKALAERHFILLTLDRSGQQLKVFSPENTLLDEHFISITI